MKLSNSLNSQKGFGVHPNFLWMAIAAKFSGLATEYSKEGKAHVGFGEGSKPVKEIKDVVLSLNALAHLASQEPRRAMLGAKVELRGVSDHSKVLDESGRLASAVEWFGNKPAALTEEILLPWLAATNETEIKAYWAEQIADVDGILKDRPMGNVKEF